MSRSTKKRNIKNVLQLLRAPSELALFFRESRRVQKVLKKLPFYSSFVLIILALYSAALLTWKVIPVPILAKPSVAPSSDKKELAVTGNQFNATQIAKYSLFGHPQSQSKIITVKVTKKVRETNVKIGLIGIIFSAHEHENRIITSVGANGDKMYKIGAILPGNIKIESIHSNHIILIINNKPYRKTLKTIEAREARNKKNKNINK